MISFQLLSSFIGLWLDSKWNFLILFTALIPLIYFYLTKNFNYWKKQGIDGPKPLPFIGSIFSLSKPVPQLYTQYWQKYGKVFGVFSSYKPVLFVLEPEIIKRILVKDFHLLRNRSQQRNRHDALEKNLINVRDDEWKRIRSILTPMFTNHKLRKMDNLMYECVNSLVKSLMKNATTSEQFEVRDPIGTFTMDVIAKCAFATNINAYQEKDNTFVRNAKSFLEFRWTRFLALSILPNFVLDFLLRKKFPLVFREETEFFENLSHHLIQERKNNKNGQKFNDMLQLMVDAEYNDETLRTAFKENSSVESKHAYVGNEELEKEQTELRGFIGTKYLLENEIVAQASVFFLAGYETTAATISFAMYELAINPLIQERLYQEIQMAKKEDSSLSYQTLNKLDYLDAVLSETMRKYPPAFIVIREASEQYHIPEYNVTLKKGDSIIVPVYTLHHLEEYYPNPEKFDPERFMPENRKNIVPYTYLPFGGGPRNCIGMRFALTEAKLALAHILDNFEIVRTPQTTDQLKLKFTVFLLKTSPIYLSVKKREKVNEQS